jgi:uncharacterized membrane protein YhaH (DUF805 family)
MFRNPFSFKGRIRRSEYGLSLIIYVISAIILVGIFSLMFKNSSLIVIYLFLIPLIWFMWAQGTKRCHDMNKSGIWQFVPFFSLWLLFADGNPDHNKYGDDPKGRGKKLIDELLADVREESRV